jgi:hypothetical protein
MAADTNTGELKWSGHYLVDPWDRHGLIDLRDYPLLACYYEENRERLCSRNVAQRQAIHWYRTIDRVNHALTATTKLYVADIRGVLSPVLDPGTTYPHHNLYFMHSSTWDMQALGGLLLSDICQFFMECYGVRMRGGYLRFQAQYLRRIRVPRPETISPADMAALAGAFARRDRTAATTIAHNLYRVTEIP